MQLEDWEDENDNSKVTVPEEAQINYKEKISLLKS